jgi:hypothetical protein
MYSRRMKRVGIRRLEGGEKCLLEFGSEFQKKRDN